MVGEVCDVWVGVCVWYVLCGRCEMCGCVCGGGGVCGGCEMGLQCGVVYNIINAHHNTILQTPLT